MKNSKLLDRINKLLAKADTSRGATQEEAELFFTKAQELMRQHGVEEIDLEAVKKDGAKAIAIDEDQVDLSVRRRITDQYVANLLARVFDVKVLFGKHYPRPGGPAKQRYYVIGDETDRAIAAACIPMVHRAMVYGLGTHLRTVGEKWTSAAEHSFCSGVMNGFVNASEEGKRLAEAKMSKKAKENYGIILVSKKEALANYLGDNYPNLKCAFRGRQDNSLDTQAYKHGYQTGATMDLNTQKKVK